MNTSLYALKPDISYLHVSPLPTIMHVIVEYENGDEISFRILPRNRERLFSILADTSRVLGELYTSNIDHRDYVEWEVRPDDSRRVVITEGGILIAVPQLPPEEFLND